MTEIDNAAALVAGPRGRRLCWQLLEPHVRGSAWRAVAFDGPAPPAAQLATEIDVVELSGVDVGEAALRNALADACCWAWYWQEPYSVDAALALPEVREALLPVARRVAAGAPGWWTEPVPTGAHRIVEWTDPHVPPPTPAGAAGKLATWRADTAEDERQAADRPADVRAPYSGRWWSAPCWSGLPVTTRALDGLGAAGLVLVEDELGWTAASCRPVVPDGDVRVAEVRSAADWVDLVARHPLDVTRSRRHDWWRASGVDGTWLIPDYAAVSAEFDALHLTCWSYLTGAGAALPVGSAHTLIAGWGPDATYWLTDRLVAAVEPEHWIRGDGRWARADPPGTTVA
ncbi:MAG: hypothetical protein ACT4RN_13755 [Pseudonocardia sp.]